MSVKFSEEDFASISGEILALERENPSSELLNILKSGDLSTYHTSLLSKLQELERGMLESFLSNSESLLASYRETSECDGILCAMEKTLESFGTNLRGVSDDIRQLQSKSEELSVRLKSRAETQDKLLTFIEGSVLSPDLVNTIFNEPIDSNMFLKSLEILKKKILLHATLPGDLPAVSESGPEFEKLRNCANSRIRIFLISKFKDHSDLNHCKKLILFLQVSEPIYFSEIMGYYVSVISKSYCSQTKNYVYNTLGKLALEPAATKGDVLGNLDSPSAGNVFSISGGRDAEYVEGNKIYWEMLVGEELKFVCNLSSLEFLFLKEFIFYFDQVFAKTLTWLTEYILSTYIRDSYDPVGLHQCITKIEFYQDMMINKKKIVSLDAFFESLLSQVRARLIVAIDWNTDSIKRIDLKKIVCQVNAPFFVTRRYAEFLASIKLNEDPKLLNAMDKLGNAFDSFIGSLGKQFSDEEVFLINNFDLIVSISGKYVENLNGKMTFLIEKKLNQHFGSLIKFTIAQEGGSNVTKLVLSEMERLVISFQGNWKSKLEEIKTEIFTLFSNLQMGKEILKNTMTQFLLYYTRFLKVVSTQSGIRQIVPAGVVMQQVKLISDI